MRGGATASTGRIEVIIGPMFSGKSTELLRRLKRYRAAGVPFVLLKWRADNRYATDEVHTHDHDSMPALSVDSIEGARAVLEEPMVVGIDEGQFFGDLLVMCEELANAGKVVIVAALDGTFERRPFEQVAALVSRAERVEKLSAICSRCAAPAAFTKRLCGGNALIAIGGSESYKAVCRGCWAVDSGSSTRAE